MPRANKSINKRLLSKVSSMYYDQAYNQQEIATRLHLSRPKVSRLLKQARRQGIVQITVIPSGGDFLEMERALEEKYGLKEAVLTDVEEHVSGQMRKRQLGSGAANYLRRTISDGDTIGVTWGTTLQAMIDAMQPKKMNDIHVVQSLGGVGPPEEKAHATDISRRLSKILAGRLTLLPAPGIVSSPEAKQVLLSDRQVNGALNLFAQLNVLYVGIGALETNPVLQKERGELSPELNEQILNSKVVGDIALHFFDINGNCDNNPIKDLIIGIPPDEIKKVETVVAIAGGSNKIDAIRGALNSGLLDVLITDNYTANLLIDTKL